MAFGGGDLQYVRLQIMADQAAASSVEPRHFPGARRMPIGWTRGRDGSWESSGVDEKLWEVFCVECGDTDGPADQQSAAVQ
jgi:hypothetical protein